MKVRVIGCHGGVAPEYQTSCYVVNDRFLIDAGSLCSAMTPQEQFSVTDIFVTHPHLDHIKDICFLLENTFDPDREPVTVRSTPAILNDLHKHIFNDIIWPDFTKIFVDPKRKRALLKLEPVTEKGVQLGTTTIKPFVVNHPGNATGYLIDNGQSQLIFTGDTGPCTNIWQVANNCQKLRAIFTEVTFPNRMDRLAEVSGHFTLAQLLEDLQKLKNSNIPIYISHFKPLFLQELLDEFYQKAPERVQLMHENDEYSFS